MKEKKQFIQKVKNGLNKGGRNKKLLLTTGSLGLIGATSLAVILPLTLRAPSDENGNVLSDAQEAAISKLNEIKPITKLNRGAILPKDTENKFNSAVIKAKKAIKNAKTKKEIENIFSKEKAKLEKARNNYNQKIIEANNVLKDIEANKALKDINVDSEELAKENMIFDEASHTLTVNKKVSEINYDVSSIWKNIKKIIFKSPKNISVIGNYAFQNSPLTGLDLLNLTNLKSIGHYAFKKSPLTTLKLSGLTTLESIGNYAFYNSTLTSLDLSCITNLKSIGNFAFQRSILTTLKLSGLNTLESIGNYAFYNSDLTTLKLSGLTTLESIGNSAFHESPLISLDLSNLTNLESIGDSSFDSINKNTLIKMSETLWKKLIYDAANKIDNRTRIFGEYGKNINWLNSTPGTQTGEQTGEEIKKDIDIALEVFNNANLSIRTKNEVQASTGTFNLKVLQDLSGSITGNYPSVLPSGIKLNYKVAKIAKDSKGDMIVTISKNGGISKSFNISIVVSDLINPINVDSQELAKENMIFDEASHTLTVNKKVSEINYDVSSIWKNIKKIIFKSPKNISVIGKYAFFSSNLTSLDLSNLTNLESIGHSAFHDSTLTTLKLSTLTHLKSIGKYAFQDSTLTGLNLSTLTTLESIGHSAFLSSKLTTLDLSTLTHLKSIGNLAFQDSTLTTLKLSGLTNLESIGHQAFLSSKLTGLNLSTLTNLESIGYQAFHNSPLTGLNLSNLTNLKSIGDSAFDRINKNILIKMSETLWKKLIYDAENKIDNRTRIFGYRKNINWVNSTPGTQTGEEIKKDIDIAFKSFNNANLSIRTKNEVQASTGTFNLKVLQDLSGSITGTYPSVLPSGIKLNYKVAKIAKDSKGDMIVTISKNGGISKSFNISIVVSDLINPINVDSQELAKENMIFDEASHTLTVNKKVSEINYDVSSIWKNIKKIIFKSPKNISVIGKYAFFSSNLTSLDLSTLTNLESIGDSAFQNSTLTTLKLSTLTNLESIGRSAFKNSNLTSLDLSNLTNLESIGGYAFQKSTLTILKLSGLTNLESIGDSAFWKSNLTSLDLSGLTNLESIGDQAFYSSPLTTLKLSGLTNLESIGRSAFEKSNLTGLDLSTLINLESIGHYAFQYSTLTGLDLSTLTNLESIGGHAFNSINKNILIKMSETLWKKLIYDAANKIDNRTRIFGDNGKNINWLNSTPGTQTGEEIQNDIDIAFKEFNNANLSIHINKNEIQASTGTFNLKVLQDLTESITGTYPSVLPSGIKLNYKVAKIANDSKWEMTVTISKNGGTLKSFNISIVLSDLINPINVYSEKLARENMTFDEVSNTLTVKKVSEINYDVSLIWKNIKKIIFKSPKNILVIGNSAFKKSPLTTLDLSSLTNLESIGDSAFYSTDKNTLIKMSETLWKNYFIMRKIKLIIEQ